MPSVSRTASVLIAMVCGAIGIGAQHTIDDTIHVEGGPLIVHRYEPSGEPHCPSVVLLSGDGGWELGVVTWAQALQAAGHEVIGVDAARLVRLAGHRGLAGVVASWPALARLVNRPAVVVGYSRGATIGLVLAARAVAPPPVVLLGVDLEDRFGGPGVPEGLAPALPRHGAYVVDLRPLFQDRTRHVRLAIVHGMLDRVARYDSLKPWLEGLPEPKHMTILPNSGHGFGDSRTVGPAIRESVAWAAEEICRS